MDWKDRYDKAHRPRADAIGAHLGEGIFALYNRFAATLARELRLPYVKPVYTQTHGWKYQYGRSGLILLDDVRIGEGCFLVQGIEVRDEAALQQALAEVRRLHADGFDERFTAFAQKRSEAQKQRTQRRVQRERAQVEALAQQTDPSLFNRFRWSPKVPRQALLRLYALDAQGLPDEALLDEIGYALYARCLQGQHTRQAIESGRLICHGCGASLGYANGLMRCECGRQYLFRDYMRSFRAENMPSGAAQKIFDTFVDRWPRMRAAEEKMRLVDGLIHEFHTNLLTGVKGRFVGVNLIEGTKQQIARLILELAYGDNAEGSKEDFARNLRKE